ncbi:MAG: sigma-54-dependent Fis family transcriptional regulator [Saprospiraceae bacterium]|nr:sigma-54-dependent Fis family transcriptional regulator [Saprospiraceae bacterium]
MEKSNQRVLIVDDEPVWHSVVRKTFAEDYEFEGAASIESMWDKLEKSGAFDLLLLDLKLDNTQKNIGLDLISPIKEKYPQVPIIIATNENDPDVILEVMETGAKGYLIKSAYNKEKWTQKIQKAIQDQKATEALSKVKELEHTVSDFTKKEQDEKYTFIWRDTNTSSLVDKIEPIKSLPIYNLLITGEIGSGKEVLARYLHKKGNRSTKPFVSINLSNISSGDMKEVLFGNIRKGILGCFKKAEGGILLLEGIGEISEETQMLLLDFYGTRNIQPVEHDKSEKIDVVVIASTRRSLKYLQSDTRFDQTLLKRMTMQHIDIPPLRERKGDIIPIIEHYLSVYLKVPNSQNMLSEEVQTILLSYDWPGNIRELRYTIDYMILKKRLLDKPQIDKDCLPCEVMNTNGATSFQADVNIEAWASLFDGIDDQKIWREALNIQIMYECEMSRLFVDRSNMPSKLWIDLVSWTFKVDKHKKGESPVDILAHLRELESQYPQASALLNRLESQFLKLV